MGRGTKKKANHRNGWIMVIVALTLVLLTLVLIAVLGGNHGVKDPTISTSDHPIKTLTIESIEEQGSNMNISTTYGILKYPFAFEDLLQVEAENQQSWTALHFSMKLKGTQYPVYSIFFNAEGGDTFGIIDLGGEWKDIPMTVVFHQAPAGSDREFIATFYAVQETFNDVISSMEENENMIVGP